MSDIRKKLLNAFVEEINNDEQISDASLFDADELGIEASVARCAINELGFDLMTVLGEFFFLPYEKEEMLYFSAVITIADEYDKSVLKDLEAAVSRINSFLPVGAFSTGPDGKTLVYRYTIPVPGDMKQKDQLSLMLTASDDAISVSDIYMGYLLLVMAGDLNPEEMMDSVLNRTDEEPEE
ncbi:MAG: hypothetical protein IJ805_04625 [Lachnospiraceae bacterium]|nr:hypothetical protein [Lachnospiraceae bacterium]